MPEEYMLNTPTLHISSWRIYYTKPNERHKFDSRHICFFLFFLFCLINKPSARNELILRSKETIPPLVL